MHYDSVERAWSVNGGGGAGATIYIYIYMYTHTYIHTYDPLSVANDPPDPAL